MNYSNEDLTKIYNDANGIGPGKNPPISTTKIFNAMKACLEKPDLTSVIEKLKYNLQDIGENGFDNYHYMDLKDILFTLENL